MENYERNKSLVQRCVQSLTHACNCRDANCHLPELDCQKMKRVVMHTKNCKRRTNGGCPTCKQLIAVCCYHAKLCQETKCLVPYCSTAKHKIKQQKLQQQLQQAQLLRRQMGVMNQRPTGSVAAMQVGQQTSNRAMTTGVAMKPGVSTSNFPKPYQRCQLNIRLIRRTQMPPAHVPKVKEAQEEIARKQALHVSYGKMTPVGGVGVGVGVGGQTGGVMPPPQMQRPLPVQMPNPSGTHLIPNMEQWTAPSRYQSNAVMQNPNLVRQQRPQQLMQQQQQQQQQHQPQPKHSLQQLMQTLRSPHMSDQQNQRLKSNPSLMAAFIKQQQQPSQHGRGVGGPLGPHQPQQQQSGLQHMMSQHQQPQHQAQPMAMNARMPQQPGAPQQFMQILRSPYTPD